uniref:Uncharacterized protein n=1 Tax=Fomitiporia mediterranea TaxID=208960 RepID=A0A5B9R999_9AGAM|nr:hypothetical protein Fomme_000045 [Fomitiporia mediterranea]QEG57041.1 hypothetical protein Fomme_000045 [Fomitiporia mediterranea]
MTKWSLFSIIITFIYSKICYITGYKYDLGFIISVGSAIGAIYSEVNWDMVYDYWLQIVDLYNRFIAKIVVKLSENPETVDYSNRAKDLISKVNERMPTDSKVKLYNQDQFVEYYINKQIEEEKLKDPNYKTNKGWFSWNSWFGWYPLTTKETLSYFSYAIGIAGAITVSYYCFESIRTIFEGFQSVVRTLNEINNMRRNSPRYIFNWVTRHLWGDNQEANQVPAPTPNNNSWYNWLTSFYPFNRNNQTTTPTNNTPDRTWMFMIPNPWKAFYSNEDDLNTQNSSNSSNSSISPVESYESVRRNKESIRNVGMDQLKALICSHLNLTPEISDADLYESIKNNVSDYSKEGSMENIAMNEWLGSYYAFNDIDGQGSRWVQIFRSYVNSPAISRENTESNNEDSLNNKGKSPMQIPGSFNFSRANTPTPEAGPSGTSINSGNTTPTPPTPRANTLNVNTESYTLDPANVPLPDSPPLDSDSTDVWNTESYLPIILINLKYFKLYFSRLLKLISFVYFNKQVILSIVKCYYNLFKDKFNSYLAESTNSQYFLDFDSFINKIKQYLINKNIIKEYIKKTQVEDNENKLAITYVVKNYEYGLGGKISYKFADTIFLHYHWDIYPNQRIREVAKDGYLMVNVYIKQNPKAQTIPVTEYDLNSLHKDCNFYIKSFEGHFVFNTLLDEVLRKNDLNNYNSTFMLIFEYEYAHCNN